MWTLTGTNGSTEESTSTSIDFFELFRITSDHIGETPNWTHGNIVRCWNDKHRILCVAYADGTVFQYTKSADENIIWSARTEAEQ